MSGQVNSIILAFLAMAGWLVQTWPCRASQAPSAPSPVVLLGDDWCPYNCDPASDHPGYAVEVARGAFAASGRLLDYREMTWARSMAEVAAGHGDAVIGMTRGEDRAFVFPREPIGVSSLGLAVRDESGFRYAGAASLSGQVVGVVASYAFSGGCGEYIKAHLGDRNLVQVVAGSDALKKNLRKLQAGRIDIVIDDANVLARALALLGSRSGLKLVARIESDQVYIAFSPALPHSRELARVLDEGVARLRASGRLAAILNRYGLRDWK